MILIKMGLLPYHEEEEFFSEVTDSTTKVTKLKIVSFKSHLQIETNPMHI